MRFSGTAGIVLIGFALVASFVIGFENALTNPITLFHFVAGILLLGIWYFTCGMKNIAGAGSAIKGRKARFSYNASLYLVVFLGLVGSLNWLAQRHDKKWDLTEEGVYSLASQSESVAKALSKPLKLVGLTGPGVVAEDRDGSPDGLKDLFELYRYSNPGKISTELFDPQAKPHLVEKYEFKAGNLIYLEYGEGEKKAVARINEATEEAVTNAIVKLQRGEAKKIYYVTGHGEPDLKSVNQDGLKFFADSVVDEHLTLEEIFLGQVDSIPADAAAVVLVSPKKPFGPGEEETLIKYAENGGHLLLLSDPRTTAVIKDLASHFGIEVGENVIIDQVQRLMAAPVLAAQPMVRTYGTHPITKDFGTNTMTIYSLASTVTAKGKSEGPVTYTELLKSSPTAWGENNMAALFGDEPAAAPDGDDPRGPVTLGVVYEKKLEAPKAEGQGGNQDSSVKSTKVVVIGDSDWIINANLKLFSNRDLVMNCMNWIVGEESGISIRPRSIKESIAPISESDFYKILGASFLIPEAILLFGLAVWWRRRTALA